MKNLSFGNNSLGEIYKLFKNLENMLSHLNDCALRNALCVSVSRNPFFK